MKEQIAKLESVLCTPSGLVVINGADGDRATVDEALGELRALAERPGYTPAQLAANMRAGLTTGAGQAQQALEKMVDDLIDAGRNFQWLEAEERRGMLTEQQSRAYHSYRRVEAKYRAMLRELGEQRPERDPPILPREVLVEASEWEAASFIVGSPVDGGYNDAVLYLGEHTDDDGKVGYGLLVRSHDYPEEGCVVLAELERPADSQEETPR